MPKQKLLSVREVAEQTGISERTIRAKIQRGDIKAQTELNAIGHKKYLLPEQETDLLIGKIRYIGKDYAGSLATEQTPKRTSQSPLAMPERVARAEAQAELMSEQLKELKEQLEGERLEKEKAQMQAGYWRGRGEELDKQVKLLTTGKDIGKRPSKDAGNVADKPKKHAGRVAKDDTKVGKTQKDAGESHTEPKPEPVKKKVKTIWETMGSWFK